MHPNFAERLFSSLQAHPARAVLRWPAARPGASATTLSGAELLGRVHAWQQALEHAGPLPSGAPVLLAQPGSPELVAALLAVLGLGAVPVLPPPGPPPASCWRCCAPSASGTWLLRPVPGTGWPGRAACWATAA